MFVSYVADHANNMYKMLNLHTKHIWWLHDLKWIARSIKQLRCICEQDAKLPGNNDNDNNAVAKYVQATGVNLILADSSDNNVPAPADQEDGVGNTDDEDDRAQQVAVLPHPACSKTLRAMQQLSTFSNPMATAYVDDNSIHSMNTESTSNQLGREVATNISDETEGELDGDLYQDHSVASMAIDYLPNFAFIPTTKSLPPLSMKSKPWILKPPTNII